MVAFVTSLIVTFIIVGPSRTRSAASGSVVTWGEAMFAGWSSFLMFWVYGVVPHQWLTWADNELNWRTEDPLRPRHFEEPAGRRMVADPHQLCRGA